MIETAFAQLRFAASMALGVPFSIRSLERMIAALKETQREFGTVGPEGAELLGGPMLDAETRHDVQERRFRKQATRAAKETAYYGRVFANLGLDPSRLKYEDIARVPLTRKEAIRNDPDAFVRRSAKPYLRCTTTGTTDTPTTVYFSAHELQVYFAFTAIGSLFSGELAEADIVQISTSARGTLGNVCLAGACAHIGAIPYLAGVIDPAAALALLSEPHRLPGKKAQTSILYTYPSYLSELVEYGLAHGYRPEQFGLERIIAGGEIVSVGAKTRAQALFGPVAFSEGFGMTEIWPLGGTVCPEGHLHFEPSQGLVEVQNPETGAPAAPGELGTLVATPFPPYRETTVVLRYDTQDMVRAVDGPLTCKLRNLPATGHMQGKRALAVRHADGWTTPRDVIEALESVAEVSLPARCGFWAAPGGVAVEVVAPDSPAVRRKLAAALEARGVPLAALLIRPDRSALRQPYPWRGDLKEALFSTPTAPALAGLPGLLQEVAVG